MNSRCFLLKKYPQCSISRSFGAITSPRTWSPSEIYTRSKSLESVCWYKCTKNWKIYRYSNADINNITSILWAVLIKRFGCWLCCQCNEFETIWTYHKLSTRQLQHGKDRWLFKTFQSQTCVPRFAHKLSQRRARAVPIDEQMVPAKTTRSGIHQYLQRKIHKWGFKNFVWAGASGLIYYVHAGQKSAGWEKCGASEVVLWLVEELPKSRNFQLFMDNWFLHCPFCYSSKPWEFYQLPPLTQIVWKEFEKMQL